MLFDWAMPVCLRFVRKELQELSPTEDAALARTCMRVLESCLDQSGHTEGADNTQSPNMPTDEALLMKQLEGLFLFALVWSTGATCDIEGRHKFDRFFRTLIAGGVPDGYTDFLPAKGPILRVQTIPDRLEGSSSTPLVHDYKFDKENCSWVPWTSTIPPLVIPPGADFASIMVPTKDSAR